jgi:hypothetical protein
MIGDVIFFKRNSSFISRIIAKVTKSEYTHVGLIVAYDELTNTATIIESDRFVDTRVNRITLDDDKYVVYTTGEKSKEQVDKIIKFSYRHINVKYDYLQILGLFISLLFKGENRYFNSKNKLICSELIDLAYYTASVERINNVNLGNITPQELLEVYEFRIRKGV